MAVITGKKAWAALMVAYVCGVIYLLAVPVWLDILVSGYKFTLTKAVTLPALFLLFAVLVSLLIAPQYHQLNGRRLTPGSFWVAAFCLLMMTQTDVFSVLLILHVIAGGAVGMAVSCSAGGMAKTANPHRMYALASLGFILAAVLYFAFVPVLISKTQPNVFFWIFTLLMVFAAVFTSIFFPANSIADWRHARSNKFAPAVWFVLAGMTSLSICQFMVLSMVESVGQHLGYSASQTRQMLLTMSAVLWFAPIVAIYLQHKISPILVAMLVACVQSALTLGMVHSFNLPMYLASVLIYSFVMIVGQIFLFGLLASIEPSGRALAATPVMMMGGSGLGLMLATALAQAAGNLALAIISLVIAVIAFLCFLGARLN